MSADLVIEIPECSSQDVRTAFSMCARVAAVANSRVSVPFSEGVVRVAAT